MTSQYQKEAEKCDSGMDSCEAAREKAEKVVGEQRKHPAIWELRAREREWREGIISNCVDFGYGKIISIHSASARSVRCENNIHGYKEP
ncbi:hypothetical protein POTOM_040402 [Populus tomentosa]|uniref:Uncharacterized protein n=1 Tax=Populus tomentosa TaxID=118781 RepID=A0A8X8CHK7_POPTO|nr:hypothetical protein POTOM_040402 [Populus tomentosa]